MGFAAVGLLFSGISTGLAVYSQAQQGKTAERVAEYNNDLAQSEAKNQELQFAEAAKREQINQRRRVATVRAQLSQTGTDSATGTPLAILGDTASNFQTSIADAARASAMQAQSMRAQGAMGLWQGQQQASAAKLSAVGTSLQGITSAVSAYGHNRYTGAIT